MLKPSWEYHLVGGLEHEFCFSIDWESSSQLTFIFFRGVGIPPTSHGWGYSLKWNVIYRNMRDDPQQIKQLFLRITTL